MSFNLGFSLLIYKDSKIRKLNLQLTTSPCVVTFGLVASKKIQWSFHYVGSKHIDGFLLFTNPVQFTMRRRLISVCVEHH